MALEKKNRRDLHKMAAMIPDDEEHQEELSRVGCRVLECYAAHTIHTPHFPYPSQEPLESEGLRIIRQGREARMNSAQSALEGRLSREGSVAGSLDSR